jgi:methyl-accepting chemotaxis protein
MLTTSFNHIRLFILSISIALILGLNSCKLFQESKEDKEARLMNVFEKDTYPIIQNIYEECKEADDLIDSRMEIASNGLNAAFKEMGEFNTNSHGEIYGAINQYTKKEMKIELPIIRLGNIPFYPGAADTIVDELSRKYGCELIICQKMNDQGDMLRVATTIKKLNGERTIGTFIPAIKPDGQENPVTSVILSGKTYYGRSFIFNAWYKTRYEPIMDKSGNIIGCTLVAIKIDDQDIVRDKIMKTYIGITGHIFVIGGKGTMMGKYIISAGGHSDGKDILAVKDPNARPIVKEMLELATAANEGEVTYYTYPWINKALGETEARTKAAALVYFEEWDWVIGASTYLEDFDYPEGR